MAVKLPISVLDKRKLAETRARLRAWWNGVNYEPGQADEEPKAAAAQATPPAEIDLFDLMPELDDVRLDALQRIWGQGRIGPGENGVDALQPTRIGAPATATLAVFGPGLAGPVAALGMTHPGPLAVFEWRDEAKAGLKAGIEAVGMGKRVTLSFVDLETFSPIADSFHGLVSFDEFTYVDNAARFAQQAARALKPKSMAIFECYCGAPGPDRAPAFASAFGEPNLRMAQDIVDVLEAAGFRVETNENVTEEHLDLAKGGFRRLAEALKDASSIEPGVARELAWESTAWRARTKLLTEGRLERRLFSASRKGD